MTEAALTPYGSGASPVASLWGIVLAGGSGVRMRPLARRICGDERPKQYVPVFGRRTLLCQTVDRVALGIAPSRTVVVTLRSHAGYFAQRWASGEAPRRLFQPAGRGTAAGILFPAHWISQRDPDATIAVFPSDHFVSEPAMFMAHIEQIARWVERNPSRLVLLGAEPTHPEVEYGWIEPGRALGATADGSLREIRRFWEKPSEEQARICLDTGCLWNTFVLVGKACTFLRAGQELAREVHERLMQASAAFGTDEEARALDHAYAGMPATNFSRAILQPCPGFLAVATMPGVQWSDLGTPRRVFEILGRAAHRPTWIRDSDLSAS